MKSKLNTEKTVKAYTKHYSDAQGVPMRITAEVRYDDSMRNGHNTLAITGEICHAGSGEVLSCGCIHDDIAKHFPELAYLLRWHLVATDQPLHYLTNALYWYDGIAGAYLLDRYSPTDGVTCLKHLKGTILYGELHGDTAFDLQATNKADLRAWLTKRLPRLRAAFRCVILKAGFDY